MKDTEKILKEELKQYFEGHGQRLTMLSKLVLSIGGQKIDDKEWLILISNTPYPKGKFIMENDGELKFYLVLIRQEDLILKTKMLLI